MNIPPPASKAFFAKWALGLFIFGTILAFYVCSFGPIKGTPMLLLGVWLAMSCQVVALALGIIGWRHVLGKFAVLGVAAMFAWTIWLASAASEGTQQERSAKAAGTSARDNWLAEKSRGLPAK